MRVDLTAQYRLVTRSDFDGLVCAVLLKKLGMIDDITFVHPQDVQDGVVEVTGATSSPTCRTHAVLHARSVEDILALRTSRSA